MLARSLAHRWTLVLAASLVFPSLASAQDGADSSDGSDRSDLSDASVLFDPPEVLGAPPTEAEVFGDGPSPESTGISLADYLSRQLGPTRFMRRVQWAGRSGKYRPIVDGKRVWKPLGPVQYLTFHHAEGVPLDHPAAMIRRIFNGHTTPGGYLTAADVGYHFFVDRDGRVWEGRSAAMLGTHVGSTPSGLNNRGNLGICVLGSFARERPTRAMSEILIELSVLISRFHGRFLVVRGHKDWVGVNRFHPRGGVDCPGHVESVVPLAAYAVRYGQAAVLGDNKNKSRQSSSGKGGDVPLKRAPEDGPKVEAGRRDDADPPRFP
jgi:hypothetical protein